MNKKLIISIVLILIVACGGILFFINQNNTDAMRFKNDYESLNGKIRENSDKEIRSIEIPKDNPMIYKTANEVVEMVDAKETFIVYFGFTDCPWCRSVLPTLIDVSKELSVDKIYYVDVKDIRDTMELDADGNAQTTKRGSDGYYDLLDRFDSILGKYTLRDKNNETVDTNEKRIYAPNVVAVKNGTPVSLTTGVSPSQKDAYMELTDEMKKDMHEAFVSVLEKISDKNGACELDQNC